MAKRPGIIRRALACLVGLAVLVCVALVFVNWYIVDSTRDDVYTIAQMQERGLHTDAILVLGASVLADGQPSDILADRLEVAADLYKAGVAPVVIVSGDHRADNYDEPAAMKRFLEDLGVPAWAITMDAGGYDTYASIWRAKNVYGEQNITITTQAYHLYRALATAQEMGMDAYGVPSDKGAYEDQAWYSIRETLARFKDIAKTQLNIPPKNA